MQNGAQKIFCDEIEASLYPISIKIQSQKGTRLSVYAE
jgi:hypothetical protein